MARTISEEDVEAVATRVVQIIGMRLGEPKPPATPALPPAPEQVRPIREKLAYSLAELSVELGVSKVSIYRLEARGLLKSLPYLRTKIYSREEVEKFVRGQAGEMRPRVR